MGSRKGDRDAGSPFSIFDAGAHAMTLAEEVLAQPRQQHGIAVLRTQRLTLRAPRPGDAKAIAVLANDRRIAANTARLPHPYRLDDAEQFIAAVNKRDGEACFVVALDGAPIGMCGVEPGMDGAELGYWLGVPYWGRGFATEAVRAVIDHAFGDLEHETLQSGARVNNPASRRVLEKCGFQWSGVRLSRIRAINSAAPIDRFRLDRGLWASLKSWGR
jgi:RimJ/RimL family protein N-acetyltransferase